MPKTRKTLFSKRGKFRNRLPIVLGIVMVMVVFGSAVYFISIRNGNHISTSSNHMATKSKPIILYVNQGNGVVNRSNFETMLLFSSEKGFNTIFFQVYRSGTLLFSQIDLKFFVDISHNASIKLFFALYFTNSSQKIPSLIYGLGEDGISLDISTLDTLTQGDLLSYLESTYHSGIRAVTTFDFSTSLKPDMLVFETYGANMNQYIHTGIVASVGVFTITSKAQYVEQFNYALENSDGVMVFDYAGLKNSGYWPSSA